MLKIYKASAGSGKTYNLTREYIKYLIAAKRSDGSYRLRPAASRQHSRLLAITFTNKATNEMTRRIIRELSILADMPAIDDPEFEALSSPTTARSAYAADFMKELQCSEEELTQASRDALTNLLYDFSYFNVSTIDSFFQSVLRMFTREVDLPDNFGVELDNKMAITIGTNELFNSLSYNTIKDTPEDIEKRWVERWLYLYMLSNLDSGAVFNMFSKNSRVYKGIIDDFNNIMGEEFKRRYPSLSEYFADQGRIVRFENGMRSISSTMINVARELARSLLAEYGPKDLNSNFYKGIVKMAKEGVITGATLASVANGTALPFTAAQIKKNSPSDAEISRLVEAAARLVEADRVTRIFKPLLGSIYIFGLLTTIMKHIEAYCRENSIFLLSETNNILSGLINDSETPFIYEKLGYYLDHLLIDEFQDTSTMQWDNLRPLVMESLSRGNDDLVIGDEKQCIYRFRNSAPELLGNVVENDTLARFKDPATVGISGISLDDNRNWRSAEEIVKFNNALFHALAALVDGASTGAGHISATATYQGIVQSIDSRRLGNHGYVKIGFGSKEETGPDAALNFMTTELRRQLASGYKPQDIAILVRRNSEGEMVIRHLLEKMNDEENPLPRFDIVSNDAMHIDSCLSVKLILSVLRLVSMPEFLDDKETNTRKRSNSYHRVRLINRFHYYLHLTHDDDPSGSHRPYTTEEALDAALRDNSADAEEIRQGDSELKSLLDMDCLNLPAIVERIISNYVPAQKRIDDNLFLTAFQDVVLDYSKNGNHDLRSFLAWWDRTGFKRSISSPPDMNALTVITVHQSKGLEYPCVHYPFATGRLFDPNGIEWFDIDRDAIAATGIDPETIPSSMPLALSSALSGHPVVGGQYDDLASRQRIDELNVNYVCFTRATTELIVHTAPLRNSKEGFHDYLLNAIEGLTSELLDSDTTIDPERKKWMTPLAPHLDGDTFTLGEPTFKTAKEKKTKAKEIVEVMPMPAYLPAINDSITRACTSPEVLDPFSIDDPRKLGDFLHAVMEQLLTPGRLDYALRRQAYRFHIDPETAFKLRGRIEYALGEPLAKRWFEGYERVLTERSVMFRDKIGRPDRVVFLPDGTIDIVDYKFVDELPASLIDNPTHNKYQRQVRRYCRHIATSTRNRRVKGYVWYIADGRTLIAEISNPAVPD